MEPRKQKPRKVRHFRKETAKLGPIAIVVPRQWWYFGKIDKERTAA